MFNSCASIFHSLRTVKFYLCVFLVCSMSFLSDYMRESININFGGKISTNLLKYILDVDSQDNFMEGFVRSNNAADNEKQEHTEFLFKKLKF